MLPNEATTSNADKKSLIACPAISESKRRRRSMGEISASKTKRKFTGVSMENVGTSLHPKKLAARRRAVGNMNTVMKTNEPIVVPIRFYGEGREPEHKPHKIELTLKKLELKPRATQHVQEPGRAISDAELEALTHSFPNKETQLHRNKQRRRSSLSIEQDGNAAPIKTYPIDYIADMQGEGSKITYLVKWSNYLPEESTWVSRRHVQAPEMLEFAHLRNVARRVIEQKLRDEQKDFVPFPLDRTGLYKAVNNAKHRNRWLLLETEFNWNTIIDGKTAEIFIENWSGKGQEFPNFEYITKNRHSEDVVKALKNIGPDDLAPDLGCNEGCECKNAINCCARYHGGQNYNSGTKSKGIRTIKWANSSAAKVVECGEHCKCDPITCRQRVLQKGRKIPLVLFWEGGKGWGLRTIHKIPKNAFIGEYVGEVISFAEAERRKENTTYQFNLSTAIPTLKSEPPVIDATSFGNETRFINHSCNPNLVNKLVITNKYSNYDSRIGFYSMRDIEPGEELTFNYYPERVESKKGRIKCRCGEKNCRGWLPTASE
ncbi:unnamed protein product, partial [Mesorhabditis belari]|uniref:Histone-lysine N-methyltransferase n=1 Tax=Mesorhabditis belari TaxID=2138241 RepID=A0AAF3FCF6_9BILA